MSWQPLHQPVSHRLCGWKGVLNPGGARARQYIGDLRAADNFAILRFTLSLSPSRTQHAPAHTHAGRRWRHVRPGAARWPTALSEASTSGPGPRAPPEPCIPVPLVGLSRSSRSQEGWACRLAAGSQAHGTRLHPRVWPRKAPSSIHSIVRCRLLSFRRTAPSHVGEHALGSVMPLRQAVVSESSHRRRMRELVLGHCRRYSNTMARLSLLWLARTV